MGQRFEFECKQCGYRAEVSDGKDSGMCSVVETMICSECRRAVEVPAAKFRFLQYVDDESAGWWAKHRKVGAVLLGKAAEEKSLTAV
jgi:hypothetical protein